MYTDPTGEFIFTILAAIFCPPLLPVAIGIDVGMWSSYLSQVAHNLDKGDKGTKAWFGDINIANVAISGAAGGLTAGQSFWETAAINLGAAGLESSISYTPDDGFKTIINDQNMQNGFLVNLSSNFVTSEINSYII
jgi:hypothetical protein